MPVPDPQLAGQLQAFGQKVRELRQAAGMTQEQLALAAETDRSYLVEIEQGAHSPGLELVFRLARALEVQPAELLAA